MDISGRSWEKKHKKLRFIFIRNGKGQKDQNTKREERGRGEKKGRAGGESSFEPGQWELQRRGWRKMGLGSKL